MNNPRFKVWLLSIVIVFAVILFVQPAEATKRVSSPPPQLRIIDVSVDFDAQTITINGVNLANSGAPAVMLGNNLEGFFIY